MGREKRPISESTDKDGLAKGVSAFSDIAALIQKREVDAVSIKAGVTRNVMQKDFASTKQGFDRQQIVFFRKNQPLREFFSICYELRRKRRGWALYLFL